MKTALQYALSLLIWAIWFPIAIMCICIAVFLGTLLPSRHLNVIANIGCKVLIHCAFIAPRLRCKFNGQLPFPVLYAANHVSFFDLFICGSVLPGYPRGMQLKEHFTKPFYGWAITKFGQIPIDVASQSSILKSFKKAAKILEGRVRSILIMPEGQRTLTGKLGPFGLGVFYLSRKSHVPVVPVVMKGLFELNNRTSIMLRPGRVDVILLDPVSPDQFDKDQDMANHVKVLIERELNG